jgi:hypothetical protein
MERYSWMLLVLFGLSTAGCYQTDAPTNDAPTNDAAAWDLKPPAPNAAPVAAKEQLPAIYPAGSRIKDRDAIGGFGPCDKYPKDLGDKDWGTKGTVSLVSFPDELVAYPIKDRGIALRLINRTNKVAWFAACDSRLFLVREAVDGDGRWRAIESLPETICGNSFHRVALAPDQYWEFPARLYSGPIKTKTRFRLGQGDKSPPTYSNTFDGEVTAGQFKAPATASEQRGQ